MRILCVLAVTMALAGLATLAPAVRAPAAHATPAAFIDLGAIFGGSENEPDENEPGDGTPARQQPPAPRSHISVVGVLLSATAGAVVALWIGARVRRLRARLRQWGRAASRRATRAADPEADAATPDRRW